MKSQVISGTAIVTILLIASLQSFSQADAPIVQLKNTLSVWSPKGYSQAAIIDLGNSKMVIISGQVPFDSNGNLVGKGDLGKQAEQVFLNIKSIIVDAGGTMDNLVKIGIYMVDISQLQAFRDVRNNFINIKYPPASTLVQVSKLFRDDVLLEVDAMAIIPKK
ncbi:RidA family protein [Flavihumibacter profundi]|uniref:RidA family protein n=1 Tax=Flavihumibacter profundi TaxID=2716883 RepID=UPI001CC5F919|nr:RidA family protein [Flavihumibacter profundi]MBZ5856834.1 RidA family protein [Flavihumibacter profundi]